MTEKKQRGYIVTVRIAQDGAVTRTFGPDDHKPLRGEQDQKQKTGPSDGEVANTAEESPMIEKKQKKQKKEYVFTVRIAQEMQIVVRATSLHAARNAAFGAPIQSGTDPSDEEGVWQPSEETDFTPSDAELVSAYEDGDDILGEAKEAWGEK